MKNIDSYAPNTGRYLDEKDRPRNIIEEVTGSIKNTESDHTASHLGYGYKAHMEIANLAAGQSKTWCWTGPQTLFAHIKNFSLTVLGSSGKLELLKGVDVTEDVGTIIPLVNNNDNSDNQAQSSLRENPTYTGGIVWDKVISMVDSTNQAVGSASFQASPFEENVTKDQNTKYVFKLTNIGSDIMQLGWIKLFFYEEPTGIIE